MKFAYFIFLMLFAYLSNAQQPAVFSLKGYGGNRWDAVGAFTLPTTDGGFIISMSSQSDTSTGTIDSFCNYDQDRTIFLKYNSDATVLEWSKCYQNIGDTFLEYMYPKPDGNVVFGGEFKSGPGWGFYITKHDASDNIIWSRSYSKGLSPLLYAMTPTTDGGYIMAGSVYYTDTNATIHYGSWAVDDIWVLKLDSLGNKVWSKVIGGTGYDIVNSAAPTSDGGCYLVGGTNSTDNDFSDSHGSHDGFIIRLNDTGNIIWHKCLGGTHDDGIGYICSDNKGGVLLAGVTGSADGDVHHYQQDLMQWVLEIDSNNNILWDNCYGGSINASTGTMCKAVDGSIWISGYVQGGQVDTAFGHHDAYIIHADSAGNYLSSLVLGSDWDDECDMVYPLSNNFILAGGFFSGNGGSFGNIARYGEGDAFLTYLAPWTTNTKQLSSQERQVYIYPNPGNDKVKIKSTLNGSYTLNITDILGKSVYTNTIKDEAEISVSDWRKGIYYVRLTDAKGNHGAETLVVQ